MKTLPITLALALAAFIIITSCNSRESYEARQAAHQARVDSINQVKVQEEALKDSLDLVALSSLKPTSTVNIDTLGLRIKFTRMDVGKRWVFDRYGDRYYYRDADRGSKYITIIADVSSEGNKPDLPSVDVYTLVDSAFYYLSSLEWKFYRWRDYGAYLGNYADNNNDFAKTETVKFTLGVPIEDHLFEDRDLFFVVGTEDCYFRRYDKFDNPPYSYVGKCRPTSGPIRPFEFLQNHKIIQEVK